MEAHEGSPGPASSTGLNSNASLPPRASASLELPLSEQVSASLDAAAASVASKTTYAGASLTVSSWLLSSEFGVLVGILIGVVGLAVQIVFKYREDSRNAAAHKAEMREHERRMKLLEAGHLTRTGDR